MLILGVTATAGELATLPAAGRGEGGWGLERETGRATEKERERERKGETGERPGQRFLRPELTQRGSLSLIAGVESGCVRCVIPV